MKKKIIVPIIWVAGVLLSLALVFIAVILIVFGSIFGENTVVQTIDSPSGKYCAEVIDSDQGALGGNTLVEVYKPDSLLKKRQRIYQGRWGEFKNMEIYWKDDTCLVINSVEYGVE